MFSTTTTKNSKICEHNSPKRIKDHFGVWVLFYYISLHDIECRCEAEKIERYESNVKRVQKLAYGCPFFLLICLVFNAYSRIPMNIFCMIKRSDGPSWTRKMEMSYVKNVKNMPCVCVCVCVWAKKK